jgi:hypothetical protein
VEFDGSDARAEGAASLRADRVDVTQPMQAGIYRQSSMDGWSQQLADGYMTTFAQ